MKVGDLIQIRQHEVIPTDPTLFRANPPIAGGLLELWVYARVLEIPAEGPVRVQVRHPGNRLHGQLELVDPKDIRDKAAVLALQEAVNNPNPQYAAQMRKHFKNQADRLT